MTSETLKPAVFMQREQFLGLKLQGIEICGTYLNKDTTTKNFVIETTEFCLPTEKAQKEALDGIWGALHLPFPVTEKALLAQALTVVNDKGEIEPNLEDEVAHLLLGKTTQQQWADFRSQVVAPIDGINHCNHMEYKNTGVKVELHGPKHGTNKVGVLSLALGGFAPAQELIAKLVEKDPQFAGKPLAEQLVLFAQDTIAGLEEETIRLEWKQRYAGMALTALTLATSSNQKKADIEGKQQGLQKGYLGSITDKELARTPQAVTDAQDGENPALLTQITKNIERTQDFKEQLQNVWNNFMQKPNVIELALYLAKFHNPALTEQDIQHALDGKLQGTKMAICLLSLDMVAKALPDAYSLPADAQIVLDGIHARGVQFVNMIADHTDAYHMEIENGQLMYCEHNHTADNPLNDLINDAITIASQQGLLPQSVELRNNDKSHAVQAPRGILPPGLKKSMYEEDENKTPVLSKTDIVASTVQPPPTEISSRNNNVAHAQKTTRTIKEREKSVWFDEANDQVQDKILETVSPENFNPNYDAIIASEQIEEGKLHDREVIDDIVVMIPAHNQVAYGESSNSGVKKSVPQAGKGKAERGIQAGVWKIDPENPQGGIDADFDEKPRNHGQEKGSEASQAKGQAKTEETKGRMKVTPLEITEPREEVRITETLLDAFKTQDEKAQQASSSLEARTESLSERESNAAEHVAQSSQAYTGEKQREQAILAPTSIVEKPKGTSATQPMVKEKARQITSQGSKTSRTLESLEISRHPQLETNGKITTEGLSNAANAPLQGVGMNTSLPKQKSHVRPTARVETERALSEAAVAGDGEHKEEVSIPKVKKEKTHQISRVALEAEVTQVYEKEETFNSERALSAEEAVEDEERGEEVVLEEKEALLTPSTSLSGVKPIIRQGKIKRIPRLQESSGFVIDDPYSAPIGDSYKLTQYVQRALQEVSHA